MSDVFVLGAGFSRAVFPSMPLLADLSARVQERVERPHHAAQVTESELLRANVELLLDYLYARQPWQSEEEGLVNRAAFFQYSRAMADVVSDLESEACNAEVPEWLSQLVRTWHEKKCAVISLNYDTIVERVACTTLDDIIAPHLWRLPICRGIARTSMVFGGSTPATLRLLKMHGSSNWYYSGNLDDPGDQVFYVSVLRSDDKRERANQKLDSETLRDKVPLIIPPVATKTGFYSNDTLRLLWHDAARYLAEAERVFFIGYSLPLTDLTLRYLLTTCVTPHRPIYVVDPLEHKLTERYRSVFPHSTINGRFGNHPDCVPQFVDSYIREAIHG